MTATINSASTIAALRIRYKDGVEKEDFDKAATFYKVMGRATDFNGDSYAMTINTDGTQGAGVSVPLAQTALAQSPNYRFSVTRVRYYSLARVTGEAMKAARDAGAVMNLWENEMQRASYTLNREMSFQVHRSGNGVRGTLLSSGSGVASLTVTIQDDGGINFFAVNMIVGAAQTAGGANRTGTATIVAIDRTARTLTTSGSNWSTQITSLSDGDSLFRAGDGANGGTNVLLTGVDSWINTAALFGLTRTPDPIKLGGQTKDCTGIPIEELGSELSTLLQQQGAMPPDLLVVNPDEGNKLRKSLIARSIYVRNEVKGATAGVSYKTFEIEGPMGTISVLEDINRAKKTGFLTRKDTWRLHTLGPCPQILNFDTQEMLRVYNDDSYEVRLGMYGNVQCTRPLDTVRCTNIGV